MAVNDAMGIGGGGGIFGRKIQLVADLEAAFKSLNKELQKSVDLSAQFAKNIKGATPGGANTLLNLGTSTGTKDAAQNDGSQNQSDTGGGGGGSRIMPFLKGAGKAALAGGALALNAMPSVAEAFEADSLRAQFNLMTGAKGGGTGMYAAANKAAGAGLPTDSMDAMRAAMTGASKGLIPSLSNYGNVMNSAATISGLAPGVGLQGGMQAMAALNQGRAINMGRMMGINIRNAQGVMNSFDNIAGQLWGVLNRQKTGAGAIKPSDIAMSLQPGNALDSMINQLGIQDPIARQAIINALLVKAGGGTGGKIDTKSLEQYGYVTAAQKSQGERATAAQKLIEDTSKPILRGFEDANTAITKVTNAFDGLAKQTGILGDAFRAALTGKGFVDTVATAGNGSGAGFLGGLFHAVGGFLTGKAVTKLAGKVFRGARTLVEDAGKGIARGARAAGRWVKTGAEDAWKVAKTVGKDAGAFVEEEALPAIEDVGMTALEGVSVAAEEGLGAVADVGTGPAGTILATTAAVGTISAFEAWKRAHRKKKKKGTGGGLGLNSVRYGIGGQDDASPQHQFGKPLAGSPPITSQFGVIRNIPGSPSFGKPHGGTDFGVPEGTPVFAVTDGTVDETSWDDTGFGNWVQVTDWDGYSALFGHLSQKVAKGGDKVKAGDLIGYSGNTGASTGPHLHFEVRKGQQKVDPLEYIAGGSTPDASMAAQGNQPQINNRYSGLKLTSQNTSGLALGGPGLVAAPIFTGKTQSPEPTHNYGGVTININIPDHATKDQRHLVESIKSAVMQGLDETRIREMAVKF